MNGNKGGAAQEVRETAHKSSNGSGKQIKVCLKIFDEITKLLWPSLMDFFL